MASRKEPVDYTCSAIDQAQTDLKSMIDTLEDLRSDNVRLRAWGNDLVSELEDLEQSLAIAKDEIEELKSKLAEHEVAHG